MATPRSPVDGFAAATMVLLCAIWGAQQVAIKLAAPDVAPVVQVALRYALSTALVGAVVAWRGAGGLSWRGTWRPGAIAGALFALEFLAISEALRRTTASHVAVFLYSAPVFTALGLHALVPAERLRRRQ
jgi:drug/metabolite transporter (DMT)-like permease